MNEPRRTYAKWSDVAVEFVVVHIDRILRRVLLHLLHEGTYGGSEATEHIREPSTDQRFDFNIESLKDSVPRLPVEAIIKALELKDDEYMIA